MYTTNGTRNPIVLSSCSPQTQPQKKQTALSIPRARGNLFALATSNGSIVNVPDSLMAGIQKVDKKASEQPANIGRAYHPLNFDKLKQLGTISEHHAACIEIKAAAIFGLGFVLDKQTSTNENLTVFDRLDSRVDKLLDPLCIHSFSDVMMSAGLDYCETANGYIEVRREGAGGKIVGIYPCPSSTVNIYVEDQSNFHYEIDPEEGSGPVKFARFGDSLRLQSSLNGTDIKSELIHFRKPTNKNRWYGVVDWLSVVPQIELYSALLQYKHDFFLNRGVPEFMLFVTGGIVPPEKWKDIENALKANIGSGNSHKSIALNLDGENITIEVVKLALDNPGEDTFSGTKEALALGIVSGHRVPPLLAGILIPGKLGASNELPNAIRAFQSFVISQEQRTIYQTLAKTLGDPAKNGGLALSAENFKMYTVTDEIDVMQMDTSMRMRQTETAAAAEGRNLDAGLKQ